MKQVSTTDIQKLEQLLMAFGSKTKDMLVRGEYPGDILQWADDLAVEKQDDEGLVDPQLLTVWEEYQEQPSNISCLREMNPGYRMDFQLFLKGFDAFLNNMAVHNNLASTHERSVPLPDEAYRYVGHNKLDVKLSGKEYMLLHEK